MSPVRHAPTPRGVVYRIGRLPDPLAWPPLAYAGGGRFDDPLGDYRVLYAGQRPACFLETLAPFRTSLKVVTRLRRVTGSQEPIPRGIVPIDWYQKRAVATLRLERGQRWLDLRSAETREALRSEMADKLLELGMPDLDLSAVMGPKRQLTQAISRWAYEHGYAGIAYRSRFDDALSMWAVFEGGSFQPVGVPEPLDPNDPDLVAAAHLFGLAI